MVKRRTKGKYMYGKFYHETYEFRMILTELFSNLINKYPDIGFKFNNDLIKLRNKVMALINSWICSKKFETKFGVKIPLDSKPTSIEMFIEKQGRSRTKIYKPCEICGEKRVSHFCHIIPYSEGGPSDESNFLFLCPTHHHLFDHHRLSKNEWEKIDFSKKLDSSLEYVKKIILPQQEKYWNKTE